MGPDVTGRLGTLTMPPVAITGATGFIGRSLMARLAAEATPVTALARSSAGRTLPAGSNLRWISGQLDDRDALERLVAGAGVVVHLAGATKARDRQMFHRINATATGALVQAACRAGVRHFILLSSLAVIRPGVSDYAASKAAGEAEALKHCGTMPVSIIRAPAVFGPGDGATEPLFAMIARGWLPIPGGAAGANRFSVVDVEDLCGEIIDLIRSGPRDAAPFAPYSAHSPGWPDVAEGCSRVLGRPVRKLVVPGPLVSALGWLTDVAASLTGKPQVFSSGKVREMAAGDWIGDRPVRNPTTLDATLYRCITPHLHNAGPGLSAPETINRSLE